MAYNPKDKNPSGVVLFGNNGSDQVFESVTDFVYDTGNTRLGINTSSPQYTLDVSGTGAFHTIRFADGTEMTTSGGGGGGGTTYTAGSGLTLDGTEFNVFGGSGNFQYIELKSSTQDPQIYFLGSGSSDTPVTLNILSSYQSASSSGSALVFDGTEGQLFAITDNLSSGVIFSVADIAGLPLIEADASGDVKLIEFGRYVGVGTGTPAYQLDVFGTGRFSDGIIFPDGNRQTIAYTGDAGGGGGTPGGSDTEVQFNDGGAFGADANFTYDKTNTKLSVVGPYSTGFLSTGVTEDAEENLIQFKSTNDAGSQGYLFRYTRDGKLYLGQNGSYDIRTYLGGAISSQNELRIGRDGLGNFIGLAPFGKYINIDGGGGEYLQFDTLTQLHNDTSHTFGMRNGSNPYGLRIYASGNTTNYARLSIQANTSDYNYEISPQVNNGVAGSVVITNDTSSQEILVVKGAASQSANLTEWQNSSSVVQAYIDETGGFSGTCITFGDGTTQCTAAAGGGTPGGSVNQIQINDGAGGFTTATDSDRLAYIPSTNTLNLGRAIATDLYSGTQVTNFWYGDNFAIGGNNFLSLGSTSDRNTAIGYGAAQSLAGGNDDNVIIGYEALNSTTTNCDLSVFVGSQVASNGGSYIGCIGIGGNILSTNSAGSLIGTIGIGYNVFNALTNGPDYDIGIGYNALNIYNESASVGGNIAIGYQAMYNILNGQYNVAIGYNALTNAGSRGGIDDNVIIGRGAAQGATTNFANNVAIGSEALGSTTNNLSTENVIIGRLAAQSCTNIDDSIVIGNNALSTLNLATAGNIILNNRDIYSAGGLVASDANRLLIGDTLGGNLLTKRIKIGGSNIVDVDTAVLEVECNSSTDVGLLVQGATSQSANLQEWQDSSATVLASMDNGGRLYYKSSYSPISDEGTASSFTFDLDTSNVFSGTLNGATTLATSNGDVGQRFLVRLKQDGTGGRTVGTWFGNRVSWPGGSAPTLSSTAGHVDLFGFLVTSGTAPTLYYDGFTIATGIQ